MTKKSATAMLAAGIMMLVLNLAVIGPVATSAVQDAVDDAMVKTAENTWENDDWIDSQDSRTYYAFGLTNLEEVNNGSDPIFEKQGPFSYDIETHSTFISHDEVEGTLTYSSNSIFTFAEGEDPSAQITQMNILYEAQRVAVFPSMMSTFGDIAGAGFMSEVLKEDLSTTQAAIRTGQVITQAIADSGNSSNVGNAAFVSWANATNYSGPDADFTDLDYAFLNADDGAGVDISLTGRVGATLFMGMGVPSNETSPARAALFGYADADANLTSARDNALYSLVGTNYAAFGGGTSWDTASEEELEIRMEALFGVPFGLGFDKTITNLLTHNDSTSDPDGLLAWSEDGLLPGLATFFSTAPVNPAWTFLEFGITYPQILALGDWATALSEDSTGVPMVLLGGSGLLTQSEWWIATWGGVDPLNGEINDIGVNSFTRLPWYDLEPVSWDESTVDYVMNGPFGLATSASIYTIYGIFANRTVPVDSDQNSSTYLQPVIGGDELPFTDEIIGAYYNISVDDAAVLRNYIENMFDGVLPMFLEHFFGVTKWSTHSVNEWLFGWHDPLLAYSAATEAGETNMAAAMADMSVGWASLESNKTYFGSEHLDDDGNLVSVNLSESEHTIYTGETDLSLVGEYVAFNGNPELWWRTTEHYNATYGLSPIEMMDGTTGGFVDGTNYDPENPPSFTLNLADYAIVTANYEGKGELHGMEVEVWSANLDPTERSVQQKLIDSKTIMDVLPGGLPIYFGSEVTLMTESVTGKIVSGDSKSFFYLDLRGLGAENPTMDDLQPVFEINRFAQAEKEDVEFIENSLHANQDPMTYWMNFDTGADAFFIDYITLLFYLGGIILIGLSGWKFVMITEDEVKNFTEATGAIIDVAEAVEAAMNTDDTEADEVDEEPAIDNSDDN